MKGLCNVVSLWSKIGVQLSFGILESQCFDLYICYKYIRSFSFYCGEVQKLDS